MPEAQAALYQYPFEYVFCNVKPFRDRNNRERRRLNWWQHGETVPSLRAHLRALKRYILTPRVSKHRLFVWRHVVVFPDSRVAAICRSDDLTMGFLQSRPHEVWSLRLGGWHGVGNDPQYTPSLSFESFPFPEGLTPDVAAAEYEADPRACAVAAAAKHLHELRETWLNPPNLVYEVPEVVPGFPNRVLPVDDVAAAILKNRTLTKLYNERPAWLDRAHRALDQAVAAVYGWDPDISDDESLHCLLALNLQRRAQEARDYSDVPA